MWKVSQKFKKKRVFQSPIYASHHEGTVLLLFLLQITLFTPTCLRPHPNQSFVSYSHDHQYFPPLSNVYQSFL